MLFVNHCVKKIILTDSEQLPSITSNHNLAPVLIYHALYFCSLCLGKHLYLKFLSYFVVVYPILIFFFYLNVMGQPHCSDIVIAYYQLFPHFSNCSLTTL